MKITSSIIVLVIGLLYCSCKGQNRGAALNETESVFSIGKKALGIQGGTLVIYQDQRGNYWFGGNDNGVYHYNGKELLLITKDDGLCSHSIIGIQEDQSGNIYFDSVDGVCKFDGQIFTTLEVIETESTKEEWKLSASDLWFRMGWEHDGPFRYDGEYLYQLEFPKDQRAEEWYTKYPNASWTPYGIYSMYQDSRGHLWFGTTALGVCRYDGQSISWLYEEHLTQTPDGGDFGIRSIIEDQDGDFWFCNTRYRYDIQATSSLKEGANFMDYERKDGVGLTVSDQQEYFPYFLSVVTDDQGDLWMVTYDEGVWQYNGEKLIYHPVKDNDSTVLLFSIYKDSKGLLWLGTHEDGVYQFDGSNFKKFRP